MPRKLTKKTSTSSTTKKTSLKSKAKKMMNPRSVARSAATVATVAGVVAAGAALMDKNVRRKVGQTAQKGYSFFKETASNVGEEAQTRYTAIASEVRGTKTKASKKRGTKAKAKK